MADTDTKESQTASSTQGPTQPLVQPSGYQMGTALVCTYLVDVASTMCQAWMQAGSPANWTWTPANACSVTQGLHSPDQFTFSDLIWSTFTYLGTSHTEPFGFLATYGGNSYLVFRGSQTTADFGMDGEYALTNYTAPTANAPAGLQVETGFKAVFDGLTPLPAIPNNTLIVTGHSLGSALATLSIPALIAAGVPSSALMNYPQASPMVGNPAFVSYYNGLNASTYRLVNSYDTVPTLPGASRGYAHVGVAATFGADYGTTDKSGNFKPSVPDNHDPCCCYSYALVNYPNSPYNASLGTCMNWHTADAGS